MAARNEGAEQYSGSAECLITACAPLGPIPAAGIGVHLPDIARRVDWFNPSTAHPILPLRLYTGRPACHKHATSSSGGVCWGLVAAINDSPEPARAALAHTTAGVHAGRYRGGIGNRQGCPIAAPQSGHGVARISAGINRHAVHTQQSTQLAGPLRIRQSWC